MAVQASTCWPLKVWASGRASAPGVWLQHSISSISQQLVCSSSLLEPASQQRTQANNNGIQKGQNLVCRDYSTHKHVSARTLTHAHIHYMHTHTHTHTCMHTRKHTLTHTHTHTQTHTHTHMHTLTRTHTHSHTHTHTHKLVCKHDRWFYFRTKWSNELGYI